MDGVASITEASLDEIQIDVASPTVVSPPPHGVQQNTKRGLMVFDDVNLSVKTHTNEQLQVLHSISGVFGSLESDERGRLVAVMGQSGSGKTSLLHVLSGQVTEGVSGAVTEITRHVIDNLTCMNP